MARAAAIKGLPHVSRTEHAVNELRESEKHPCKAGTDTQMSIDVDPWIPIYPDGIESAMLSSDTDLKSWKEAMASYDAAERVEGLRDEMVSL